MKLPDLQKMQEYRYLTNRQVQECLHIGYKKTATLLAELDSDRSAFERMQRTTYYKRILQHLDIKGD